VDHGQPGQVKGVVFMRNYLPWEISKFLFFISCVFIASLFTGCLSFQGDDYRENLTLEDAQGLVSFQICIPDFIPPEVNPIPKIIYSSDWADVPEEKYIRLQYKWIDNNGLAFEVYQRLTNDEEFIYGSLDNISEYEREQSKVDLLDWVSYPNILSESEIKSAIGWTQMKVDVFQTDQTVWRYFEIVMPREYRSTKTNWVLNSIEYRVLSKLPPNEIIEITESMMDCRTKN
jgi:hypothetical protein